MEKNLENKLAKNPFKIAEEVSFETSLKYALLTGLLKNGEKITKDNEEYIISIAGICDGKIDIKLVPYKQAC